MSLKPGRGGRLARLTLCAALVLAPAPLAVPAHAETITFTRPQALAAGQRAIAIGRGDLAEKIAAALLEQHPGDTDALLMLSAAQAGQGRSDASLAAATTAAKAAKTPEEKFQATYLRGVAHAHAGNDLRAKFWLRRAGDLAPDPHSAHAVAETYGRVAAQSKLRLGFDLNLGPSRNLNGGSLHDSIVLLPGLAVPLTQALPGIAYGGTARFTYRLAATQRSVVEASGSYQHRGVHLSDRARRIAPGISDGDLAFSAVTLGLARRWTPEGSSFALGLSGQVSRRWYGGTRLSDQIGAEFSVSRALGKRALLRFALAGERSDHATRPVRDVDTLSASATLSQDLGLWGRLDSTVTLRRLNSDAAGLALNGQALRLGWTPRQRPGKVEMAFGLGLERQDYYLTPAVAPDLRIDLSANFAIKGISYMGFSPELRVQATRIRSDFKPRDTFDFGFGLGVRSSF